MIKVTVYEQPVRTVQGVSTKNNKPYKFTTQTIYCHVADTNGQPLPVPEKSEVMLDDGQLPYPAGDYTLSPASLYVDRNGRLAVAPKLVPLKKPA